MKKLKVKQKNQKIQKRNIEEIRMKD